VVAGGSVIRRMRANSEFAQSKRRHQGSFRDAGNRGSTLIEAAIVLPIILLVVLGTVEIGLAFKDFLTVGAMSRDGARIAALSARDAESDCAVLKGIAAIGTQGDIDKIDDVQIYKAAEGTGAQALATTNTWTYNGGDADTCTVPRDPINDGWDPGTIGYPPSSRNTTIGSTSLDIIGVRITLTRDWITGFPPFRGSFTIDETTITRVEPEAFQ
jgi:Flp pilus assembly protein TadG